MNEIYVVEWSNQQKCFHITTAEDSASMNLHTILGDNDPQYHVIAVCDSSDKADEVVRKLKKMHKKFNVPCWI